MPTKRELRDPIHGFVFRTELEEKLIDTQVFQRLRGIHQLALARLVYPGAVHTRFDHSIGVMHVAGRLAEQLLGEDSEEPIRKRVRIAALLHDIGHGPFSHVSESLLNAYAESDELDYHTSSAKQEEIHEHLTCRIIQTNPELCRLISQEDRRHLVDLLLGRTGERVVKDIVSGPLDADKQDYLLRDSHFCGVKYGVFDLYRLIDTLTTIQKEANRFLGATEDGIYAIEQFVLAKYHMNAQVYRHKVRLATDAMIVRALELGIEKDDLGWLKDLYTYDGSEEFIENYVKWDDTRIISRLLYHPDKEDGFATQLFRRLRNRNLFKVVFGSPLPELEFERPIHRSRLFDTFKKLIWPDDRQVVRRIIERRLATYLSEKVGENIDPNHVIVWTYQFKSVREQSKGEGPVFVQSKNGDRLRPLTHASDLFNSIDDEQKDKYVKVFAPLNVRDKTRKKRLKLQFQEEIPEILAAAISDIEAKKGE